jgi:uncharacterized protein YfaP (DUF2135 family)
LKHQFFLAACVFTLAAHAQSPELAAPRGGWSAAPPTNNFTQDVHYPASRVNLRGDVSVAAQIRGVVRDRPKNGPSTLVVNGVPMPLETDDAGAFARPYAFAAGSNSVQVQGAPGSPAKRVQFYETPSVRPKAALRIIASWDDNQAEIDMHVVTPDGQHAFWAAPVLQGGGGLDADSVDGAGPEMFSIAAPRPGRYHVFVNYWGNFGSAGYHFDEKTRQKPVITARITIVRDENTLRERRESFVVPLRKVGDLILVKSVAL